MIVLLPPYEQTTPVLEVAKCQFGEGHEWVDVTKVIHPWRRFVCRYCGAKGREIVDGG